MSHLFLNHSEFDFQSVSDVRNVLSLEISVFFCDFCLRNISDNIFLQSRKLCCPGLGWIGHSVAVWRCLVPLHASVVILFPSADVISARLWIPIQSRTLLKFSFYFVENSDVDTSSMMDLSLVRSMGGIAFLRLGMINFPCSVCRKSLMELNQL